MTRVINHKSHTALVSIIVNSLFLFCMQIVMKYCFISISFTFQGQAIQGDSTGEMVAGAIKEALQSGGIILITLFTPLIYMHTLYTMFLF